MAQEIEGGLLAESPQEGQQLEAQGYVKCKNPRCLFYNAPEVMTGYAGLMDDVEQGVAHPESLMHTCPYCGFKYNIAVQPGMKGIQRFQPGGATHIGLPPSVQGQIGEDLVFELGNGKDFAGYGPFLWWHQGGADSPSHLDGMLQNWGVEVKTIDFTAQNRRFIVNNKDAEAKNRAAQDPRWFAGKMEDPELDKVLDQLDVQGVLGVLCLLNFDTSTADVYVREFPYEQWGTNQFGQPIKGVRHFRDTSAVKAFGDVPFKSPLPDPTAEGFVPFHEQQQNVRSEAEEFGAFAKTADLIGDSHPAQEPQAVSDIDTRYSPNEWELGPTLYRFVFGNGELEVSPTHTHEELTQHAGGPGEGPTATGYVAVDKGRATWEVMGNVGISSIAKVLKDYSKRVGWDWGGLTDHQGELVSDEFAPTSAVYYMYDPGVDHLYLAERQELLPRPEAAGVFAKSGSTIRIPGLDGMVGAAVLEWANDQGYKVVLGENVIKNIEDLEQWNWSNPNPAEPAGQYDREPTGVFRCPQCDRLFGSWGSYLMHRQEEEPPGEDNPPSKFPEVNQNAIEDSHFTPMDRHNAPVSSIYRFAAPAPPEGKDLIEDAVPFVYDIEADAIYVGQPGTSSHEIEMGFTPGGIVEGTYEPGGKVYIDTQTTHPYSLRHLVDLWYNQHPEFEVRGLYQRTKDGKEKKLAAAASPDDLASELRVQAKTDPAVWGAYQALKGQGGKVYIVGGAVRDALKTGEPPKDIDLLVQGIPSAAVRRALEALPGRVDLTGKDFGVYRYRHAGHETEIALPRKERSTGDAHTDFDVTVDHTMPIQEDLERRDFTVNAMAVDLDDGELLDPFGGQRDLRDGVLRIVHERAFDEDPLRVVRALVAASRHGLRPDASTRNDMRRAAVGLNALPPERIQAELDKLMASRDPETGIRLAHDTGVLGYMLPEVESAWDFDQNNPHHEHTLGEHLMQVLRNTTRLTDDPDVRLAALLHDIGKPDSAWTNPETGFSHFYRGPNGEGLNHDAHGAVLADERLRALRYPNARVERVRSLIEHHMYPDFSSPAGARKFLNRVGEHADDLLHLRDADREGHGTPDQQALKTPVEQQRDLITQVRNSQEPTERSMLAINGNDLIQQGMKPGPELGQTLNRLTELVVENPALNTREQLLDMAFMGKEAAAMYARTIQAHHDNPDIVLPRQL